MPPFMAKAGSDAWPTPLEMLDLMDAVDAKQDKVMLSDKEFTVDYWEDKVLVKPVEGIVPMGWFDDNDFRIYRGE